MAQRRREGDTTSITRVELKELGYNSGKETNAIVQALPVTMGKEKKRMFRRP